MEGGGGVSEEDGAEISTKIITSHDVLERLNQALLASRNVIISSQFGGSKLQSVFHIR